MAACGPSAVREARVAADELGTMLLKEWHAQRMREAGRHRWVSAVRISVGLRGAGRHGPRAALARLLLGLAVRIDAGIAADPSSVRWT